MRFILAVLASWLSRLPAGKEEVYIGKVVAATGNNRLTSNTATEVILGKSAAEVLEAEAGKTIPIAGEDITRTSASMVADNKNEPLRLD